MAGMKSIDEARQLLENELLQLTMTVKAFNDLAGENDPPWLWLLKQRIDTVDELAQGYMMAVHEHARPVLNDLAKLTK